MTHLALLNYGLLDYWITGLWQILDRGKNKICLKTSSIETTSKTTRPRIKD